MESHCIEQFLHGKTILITGATGFLAKILIEKILRVQPNVKKLYLLIRAKDMNSAKQRFNNEILETDLFGVLREKLGDNNLHGFIEDKVFPVHGDIARDSLGINYELKDQICREIDIIVNSAATTRFDERYDSAIRTNVVGAMNVVKLSKQCPKVNMLLHVSTAYVCGEKEGLILEKPLNYGETLNGSSDHLDIDAEIKLVEKALHDLQDTNAAEKEVKLAMRVLGIERARLHGWPNTYSFTKAMGEMLLGRMKEDLQLVILRPTIILSTYKEPFPGWIEGMKTTDTFIVGYGKGIKIVLAADKQSILDVIPADMVVNSVIAAMAAHQNPSSHTNVYHISSSKRNQIKLGDVASFIFDYFKNNLWVDERGKPVKVKEFSLLESMDSLHKYVAIHYMPLLKILEWANWILFQQMQAQYTNFQRRINYAIRLAELYKPYTFFKGIFDDTNAEMLRMATRECNTDDTFNFDPATIQWEKYFKEIHIPGLVKYIF